MLVIMKYWNVHELLQLLFNIEAIWALDVFKVDSSETGREVLDTVDEVVRVLSIHAQIDALNSRKLLEEHRLALHDGLRCQSADISEAEHRCSIGDDSDHIALGCVSVGHIRILLDLDAGLSDTGRVCQSQVLGSGHYLGCIDGVLAWLWQGMVLESICLLFHLLVFDIEVLVMKVRHIIMDLFHF